MKRIAWAIIAIALVCSITGTAFAVQNVGIKPLSQVVKGQVEDCSNRSYVNLPLITWGGDIATIHGNGDQVDTKQGSIFSDKGLKFKLFREDVLARQVEKYMACETPYLRGTLGMINMAAEVANKDPRTEIHVFYKHTDSVGGDQLVVKGHIKRISDIKVIAMQAYGPHIEYFNRLLKDAGKSWKDVKVIWTKDLTGTDETPLAALYENGVDAAMLITPDAMTATSGGKVGTGAEGSVKGARVLITTKSFDTAINDVYGVRMDYYNAHKDEVEAFAHALMLANEATAELFRSKAAGYNEMLRASAQILLDSPDATSDTEGLYADCRYSGWKGNVKFFTDKKYTRDFAHITSEIQHGFTTLGVMTKKVKLSQAEFDYNNMKAGLRNVSKEDAPRFDTKKVAQVVAKRQATHSEEESTLFPPFEIFFMPNKENFSSAEYESDFDSVIAAVQTYGGAVMTVEGHSDPLEYLRQKKNHAPDVLLRQMIQVAKKTSEKRAENVRAALIKYAKKKGITIDPSQIATTGYGYMQPKTGMCGADPCAPKNEKEWQSNMRAVFRLILVEGEAVQVEATEFQPL